MTIINFDNIIGKNFNTITNNVFCLSHPKNALIIGRTSSGKTNILMNLIAQNSVYETSIEAKSSFSRPAVVKVVDQLELFNHSLH